MKTDFSQIERLDSLRAGLSIDDVDFKNTCTPRLVDRENAYWQRIVDTLEGDVNSDRATCNRLRILRRQVINGECRKSRPAWGLPPVAAGAAAGFALFFGAAVWWDSGPREPASMTRTASIEPMEIDNAEFANNVDFYTWLENQSDTVADSGGS